MASSRKLSKEYVINDFARKIYRKREEHDGKIAPFKSRGGQGTMSRREKLMQPKSLETRAAMSVTHKEKGKCTQADCPRHQYMWEKLEPHGFQRMVLFATGKGGLALWGGRSFIADAFHPELNLIVEVGEHYFMNPRKLRYFREGKGFEVLVCDAEAPKMAFDRDIESVIQRVKTLRQNKS